MSARYRENAPLNSVPLSVRIKRGVPYRHVISAWTHLATVELRLSTITLASTHLQNVHMPTMSICYPHFNKSMAQHSKG